MDDFEIPTRIWVNLAVLASAVATAWAMLFDWSGRSRQAIRSAWRQGRPRSRVDLKS
jgi:hypothetical protein